MFNERISWKLQSKSEIHGKRKAPKQADMVGGVLRQGHGPLFKASRRIATRPRSDMDPVNAPQCPMLPQSKAKASMMAALLT